MNRTLAPVALTVALAAALLALQATSQELTAQQEKPQDAAAETTALPDGLNGFSGMLLGKLQSKDVERGVFTLKVDYVPRVWRNNKATKPRSLTGRTVVVEGVTGKWLDQLLLIKPGESMMVEAKHVRGDRLRFPGEMLQKADPYEPSRYPTPPKKFRGFRGIVTGEVVTKMEEHRELVLRVSAVERSFENDKADDPQAVVGKPIVVAGFWQGQYRKMFDDLSAGDSIRAGLIHRVVQSDHFSVAEVAQKTRSKQPAKQPARKTDDE